MDIMARLPVVTTAGMYPFSFTLGLESSFGPKPGELFCFITFSLKFLAVQASVNFLNTVAW